MKHRLNHQKVVDFEDARVVITGASSGIGLALARQAASRGARLVLAARHREALVDASDDIATIAKGFTPIAVCCDVREKEDVERLIATAVDALGGIDILINNAGTCVYGEAARTTTEDFTSMLRVHVMGPFYGMQAAIPHMQRQGSGVIVNVASLAALYGVPYLGAYGAAKAALVSLSQSFRSELRGSGIRVVSICPGYTDTKLFAREKNVGGARRPNGPYRSADAVAQSIIRAIETGKQDVVLSFGGKLLALMRSVWPGLVRFAFTRMAARLQEDYRYA
jgi:short-subunit dehydrogenase